MKSTFNQLKLFATFLVAFQSIHLFAQNNQNKVRMEVDDNMQNTFYEYDAQGRLSKMHSTLWNFDERYIYRNDSVLVYAVEYLDSTLQRSYTLNKDGLQTSEITLYQDKLFYEYYEYKNKYKVATKKVNAIDIRNVSYVIENSNVVKEYFLDSMPNGMTQHSVFTYTFLNTKNPLTSESFGRLCLGKSNENLIDTETSIDTVFYTCSPLPCKREMKVTQNTTKHTYEFDEKGRIKSDTKIFSDSNRKALTRKYYYLN